MKKKQLSSIYIHCGEILNHFDEMLSLFFIILNSI